MLHIVMSTLVTMPYKKWDPFTELWLCNPALGLADPERVPEQPEGSPEPLWMGAMTGPSSSGVPSFGPCPALLALGYFEGIIPQPMFRPSLLPGVQPFSFKPVT